MNPWIHALVSWFCVGFSMFLGRFVFCGSKEFALAVGLVTAVLILSAEINIVIQEIRKLRK